MIEIIERLRTALADRYLVERELGAGGMATVFLADDLKHKRKVALKVLKPELAAVLGAERFVQEIATTASLQHPHILPLFDSGTAGQRDGGIEFLYYVMPYIEGETLRDKLNRETQLSVEEAIRITTEVADALDYAHRHHVIHRDIKPENILMHDGRPMVADFGIALAVSAAAGGRMTETGLSLGTPHYMSPEQATAEKELTNRSDIYSLGSVLFEMLTGEPPHVGGSAQAVIMKIVTDTARPVTDLRKSVPPNVAAATAKALEKLAADRFETAAKFAEALANPFFAITGGATAAGRAAPTKDWRGRAAVPLALLATLLSIVAVWGWRGPHGGPLPVIRYELTFPADEALAAVYGPSIALSPDGELMVYPSPSDGPPRLRLRRRDKLSSDEIPGTDRAWQPFFAPDGRRIAFITANRELKIVSVSGEPPLTIADSGLWRNGGAWGRDGYLYVGWQAFGTILARIPDTGGPAEPLTTLDSLRGEVSHAWPDALPGRKGVLFTAMRTTNQSSASDEIAVLDLRTGEHRALVQGILGRYMAGFLVIVRFDGTLLAAPFDEERLVITGPTVPLASGMPVISGPDVALSSSGRFVSSINDEGGEAELIWIDRSGAVSRAEDDWTVIPEFGGSPVLSPDGRKVALAIQERDGTNIWIKELDGGPFTKLTMGGNGIRPSWTPDGASIVYRDVQPGLSYDLFTIRADGSATARVLLDPADEVSDGFWSRDGKWLIVSSVRGDILALRPGTDSALSPLLHEAFMETAPALSPNGRWLAYVSNESGRAEVYVRSFPDVSAVKQQISTGGGVEPRWAHSGRELFYKAPQEFMAVSVNAGEAFRVLGRRALFPVGTGLQNAVSARYDVSPDDKRFLTFQSPRIGSPGQAIFVENFLREVREKVPR